jgi:catechol 2,3-dioxygenase-like lactoylglutathione lyase family enzyme
MLNDSKVEANIPAGDLKRARDFYADKLGMTPTQEFGEEALAYTTAGGTTFTIYRTEYAGQAGHTIAQWHVTDLDSEVQDLEGQRLVLRGVRHARGHVGRRDRHHGGHGPRRLVQGQRGQHHVHRRHVHRPLIGPDLRP